MDDNALILLMVGAVNRLAEGFKLFVLDRFQFSDNGRKVIMLLVSALFGLLIMLFWPGAFEQLSRGTVFGQYGMISQVLFGLALGAGSEVLWRLLKLGGKPTTPPQETTPQG